MNLLFLPVLSHGTRAVAGDDVRSRESLLRHDGLCRSDSARRETALYHTSGNGAQGSGTSFRGGGESKKFKENPYDLPEILRGPPPPPKQILEVRPPPKRVYHSAGFRTWLGGADSTKGISTAGEQWPEENDSHDVTAAGAQRALVQGCCSVF